MTRTGALDLSVFGSPTEERQIDRVTFSHASESTSSEGSYDSQVRPRNSPRRKPVNAAVATAVAEGSGRTLGMAAISSSEYGLVSVPLAANAGISANLTGFAVPFKVLSPLLFTFGSGYRWFDTLVWAPLYRIAKLPPPLQILQAMFHPLRDWPV